MIIRKISHFLCNYENIIPLFAGACLLLFLAGILLLPLQLRVRTSFIPRPLTGTVPLIPTIAEDRLLLR